MPRSRRRHHSRSRSRSHSHDRDREAKRRRIESPDSAHHRRTVSDDLQVSPEEITSDQSVECTANLTDEETSGAEPEQHTAEQSVESETNNSGKTEEVEYVEEKESTDKETVDQTDDKLSTPKKNQQVRPERGTSSSRKKQPEERIKAKEDREKKRQEAKETKEKLRLEKKEQKEKERQEKEEQKKKERLEKEEQRRKEKEEKDEQKKKEREEKEEQKKKEREEKEEQKKKEREEKEEQKRKEREEKELKKQQELEKDKKKKEKEAAAFVNFFVARKSANASELKKNDEVSSFMPFEVKADMRLAPSARRRLSAADKTLLTEKICTQDVEVLYLNEMQRGKVVGKDVKTWPVEENEVIIVEDTGIGECVEEPSMKNSKMRAKLLKFHENRRPAYFGTWRKNSDHVRPRKPFARDKETFDYEVDSDEDWEEEEPGESLHGSDDEDKENESDEYEVDNDFFVPHGYLSDEEAENEENMAMTPETQKEKLKILQMEFEEEMKSKTERIKPRLIGCLWESKLKPKIQDAINTFLEERMMIVLGPITVPKRGALKESKQNALVKTCTPTRKQLSRELIPDFLRMVHGNVNNQTFLVNEFLNFMSARSVDIVVSKTGLCAQLKELAKWKKCPDEGSMFNKQCWYVPEHVRKQYGVNLELPNRWSYTSHEDNANVRKKLSL